MEKLKRVLGEYGEIQAIKEGVVFTVFITGHDLSNWSIINDIQQAVLGYAGKKYPTIEVMKNTENFFLLILKP